MLSEERQKELIEWIQKRQLSIDIASHEKRIATTELNFHVSLEDYYEVLLNAFGFNKEKKVPQEQFEKVLEANARLENRINKLTSSNDSFVKRINHLFANRDRNEKAINDLFRNVAEIGKRISSLEEIRFNLQQVISTLMKELGDVRNMKIDNGENPKMKEECLHLEKTVSSIIAKLESLKESVKTVTGMTVPYLETNIIKAREDIRELHSRVSCLENKNCVYGKPWIEIGPVTNSEKPR